MAKTQWNQTEKEVYLCFYGIVASAFMILAVSKLIEACRSRPKVQVLAFGLNKPKDEPEKAENSE